MYLTFSFGNKSLSLQPCRASNMTESFHCCLFICQMSWTHMRNLAGLSCTHKDAQYKEGKHLSFSTKMPLLPTTSEERQWVKADIAHYINQNFIGEPGDKQKLEDGNWMNNLYISRVMLNRYFSYLAVSLSLWWKNLKGIRHFDRCQYTTLTTWWRHRYFQL